MLVLRRFASYKTKGFKEVQKLVPTTLKVVHVKDGVAYRDTDLKNLDVAKTQMIKIVNMRAVPGQDEPEVVVQVVDQAAQQEKLQGKTAKKEKPAKKVGTKEVQISWSISENDLLGPKLTAIQSVLGRGHSALVKFQNKKYVRGPSTITQDHLEARQRLVDKLDQRLEAVATRASKVGTLSNMLEILYKCK